ncbi:MAG: hypothetical protein ACMZ64_04435 [Oleiphilus sp.]
MKLHQMKTRFSKSKLAIALSASIALVGCGGSGQDEGSPASKKQVSGLAIDGQLARATVFADSNNNGTRDAWETFAFTDNEGYYSYNPNTQTNYCASNATPQQEQYCLRLSSDFNNVVIRIDGGYDILTGEPFVGQMSRRVDLETTSDTDIHVVSPITSLLSNVDSTTDQQSLLTSLGLEESDLDVNYLDTEGAGAIDSNLLNTALKIHKTVSLLSDRLTDTYTEIGDNVGTPNDATSSIYPNLAQKIISSESTLNATLANTNFLATVLDNAENEMRAIYERKEFTLPQDLGSPSSLGGLERVVNIATRIPDVVDNLIDPSDLTLTQNEAKGGASALETLVIKTVNEESDDSSIDNAINFFTDDGNDTLIQALTDSLSQGARDLSSIVSNDFTGDDFDTVEEIQAASTLPLDATPFSDVSGKQIKVSVLDLGSAGDLKDIEVEIYFEGDAGDLDGSLTSCVKYIDEASRDETSQEITLGDGNTRGELVSGFWSLLGTSDTVTESYSLVLTISFLGTTYSAIMKPTGEETIDATLYQKIRFDFDGDFETYHSEDGLVDQDSVPTTNEACETQLPLRV